MNNLSKAKARLCLENPFFATLLLSMPMVLVKDEPGASIKTAATDMKHIYFNEAFLESMTDVNEVITVLCHEVAHVAWDHCTRLYGRNPMIWNMAGDFAINLVLSDQGMKPPQCGWLHDEKYRGMSADQIYDDLMKQADAARKAGWKGEPEDGGSYGMPGANPMQGDVLPMPGGDDPAQVAEAQRQMKQKVAQAATMARMAGKLKGELARFVDEILDPKVPWPDLLRDYMLRVSKDDETWRRRNRRFQHTYLPTRHSERMGPIIIIGDSSGSIWCSPKELEQFAAEITAVADQVQPEHIRLIWADTQVRGETVFEQGDPLVFDVKGGGGTDMRVPLAYAEQYDPEVVVLLTDGYTPWPECEPPYPLIVVCSTETSVPIGNVVRI